MIRIATTSDVNDIFRIYNNINIKSMIDRVKNTKHDFSKYIENGNINVFDSGGVIGFVLFFDHITWGYIELLCVDPQNRLDGVGKKLIDSINNPNWGVVETCCHLSDMDSNLFVRKCGFVPSNQETVWYVK